MAKRTTKKAAKSLFKGDVVQLNSGGPDMTVSVATVDDLSEQETDQITAKVESGEVLCIWFSEGKLERLWIARSLITLSSEI